MLPISVFTLIIGVLVTITGAARSSSVTVAYISNADSRDIYVLQLDEPGGGPRVIQTLTVTGKVMPLAVSPDRRFLYASLRSEPYSVSSLAIDQRTGTLTLMKTVPLADNMAYLATDRTGRFLLGASYSGNRFSINAISSDGTIDPKPLHVVSTGRNAHAIATDPSNRFLFVSNLGDDQILQYRFDERTGAVTANQPAAVKTKPGAGPRHVVFHPSRRLVFGTNELDATVSTYRLEDAGTLTLLESTSMLPAGFEGKPWAADLHLTPDGSFLYASERTSSTIAAFRVDGGTGRLTPVGHYPTETQPRGFSIDPEGRYLLAVGELSNGLTAYAIDRNTGTLRTLSHLDVGGDPNWIEIVTLRP